MRIHPRATYTHSAPCVITILVSKISNSSSFFIFQQRESLNKKTDFMKTCGNQKSRALEKYKFQRYAGVNDP